MEDGEGGDIRGSGCWCNFCMCLVVKGREGGLWRVTVFVGEGYGDVCMCVCVGGRGFKGVWSR